jgi:hypothetical protein
VVVIGASVEVRKLSLIEVEIKAISLVRGENFIKSFSVLKILLEINLATCSVGILPIAKASSVMFIDLPGFGFILEILGYLAPEDN